MKDKKVLYLLVIVVTILLLTISTNCSNVKTIPYNSNNINKTLYYALPKTFLDITVELELVEVKNAPYIEFAKCYGIISEINKPSKTYSIKSINAETSSVLDISKLYETKIINGFFNKTEFNNIYNSKGELTSSDYKAENQGLKFVTSTIKFATSSFFGGALAGEQPKQLDPLNKCLNEHVEDEYSKKEIEILVGKLEELNGDILRITENASDYSNLNVFKANLKYFEDEKTKIINENFGYSSKTSMQKFTFKINPDSIGITESKSNITKDSSKTVLFQFDKENGLIPSSNPQFKKQVWNRKKFSAENKTNEKIMDVIIDLDVDNSYANAISESDTDNKGNSASFYYRIPSFNKLLIYQRIAKKAKKKELFYVKDGIQLTQFGRVIGAPISLAKVKYELHPKTGALKSISGNSSVVDSEQLNALQTQLEQANRAVKGEDDIDVEINNLKKEVELLDLLKKKGVLEKEDY